MKNNRISESLDRAMADSTWKEKNREHVLQRIHHPEKAACRPIRQRIAVAAAFALVLVLCLATALATFSEDANMLLYHFWPEAARALRPVALSCEKGGIRMEVLSASATGNSVLVTYSMTDLAGKERINEYSQSEGWLTGKTCYDHHMQATGRQLSYDPEKQQAIFACYSEFDFEAEEYLDGMLEFTADHIGIPRESTQKLEPFITGREYTAEAVPAPTKDIMVLNTEETNPNGPAITPILNPANSMEIQLTDGYILSGIGYIDGVLHVQTHQITENPPREPAGRRIYNIVLLDREGNRIRPIDRLSDYPNGEFFITWGDETNRWEEYLFPIAEDKISDYELYVDEIAYTVSEELQEYRWTVQFPVSMIQTEDGEQKKQ